MARKKGSGKTRRKGDPEVPSVSRERLVQLMKEASVGAAELHVRTRHLFRRL